MNNGRGDGSDKTGAESGAVLGPNPAGAQREEGLSLERPGASR